MHNESRAKRSEGMTLVELMVAVTLTMVVMTLSLSLFFGQIKSYKRGMETKEIQETGNTSLGILKSDLAQAGWSVRPEMSFYFQDGGNATSDQIYMNDTSLIDLSSSTERSLMTQSSTNCGGCAEITGGGGTSTVTVSAIDIDSDNSTDFKPNASHYVISDLTNITGGVNKVARITTSAGNPLVLNQNLGGSFLAPAVYYSVPSRCCDDSDKPCYNYPCLKRSDRSSGGLQPLAEIVVDLQVAYQDRNGNWYGASGCGGSGFGAGFCTRSPFDPRQINLIRLTLISRSTDAIASSNSCRPAAENRAAAALGSSECGYVYRVNTVFIQPRNTGIQ